MLNSYSEFMAKSADQTGTAENEHPMLTSYPVACPHENCGWTGNLIPSHFREGEDAEIVQVERDTLGSMVRTLNSASSHLQSLMKKAG